MLGFMLQPNLWREDAISLKSDFCNRNASLFPFNHSRILGNSMMEYIYSAFPFMIVASVGWFAEDCALVLTTLIWMPLHTQISWKEGRGYHMNPLQRSLSALFIPLAGSIILILLNSYFYLVVRVSSSDILLANSIFLGVCAVINLVGIGLGIWLDNSDVKGLLKSQELLGILQGTVLVFPPSLAVIVGSRVLKAFLKAVWKEIQREVVLWFEDVGIRTKEDQE
jgi:hypothetical protein